MRIAFYPAQAGKPFTGNSLETGSLGGSETAVIYIARELAKLGHEVIVFTRAEVGVFDDVVYLDFYQAKNILRTLPLDVLVCSRDPLPLIWRHNAALTLLWNHDLPQHRLPTAHIYAFVSIWQAQVYVGNGFAPAERGVVLPNGVDMDLFPAIRAVRDLTPDDEVHLAWTSNPERGLWHMGQVLQLIRKEYPKTQLHVYGRNSVYGWGESYEGNFLPDDMTGVVLHESQSKQQLANALTAMDLWVYPTWWPETYCIAAVEAQAAGVPVIASNFGALQETAKSGILVDGKADNPGHLEAMASIVLDQLKSADKRHEMQTDGVRYAATQTWKAAAAAWNTTLIEGMSRV